LLIFGGDFEEYFTGFLTLFKFGLVEVDERKHFHGFLVFWIKFKTLF
jgi:hypothetical protein